MPGVNPSRVGQIVLDPELLVALLVFAVAALERVARPFLQFGGDLDVEALDLREVLDRDVGHFLERAEPFGHQQMGDDVVDVERVDEHLAAGAELLGAALRFLGLGQDVDVPAGQLRGEPHILAAAADREATADRRARRLRCAAAPRPSPPCDFGRRQRIDDEGRRIRTTTG